MSDLVVCVDCGELHPRDEIELTFRRPDAIAALSESERDQCCREHGDLSAILGDGEGPVRLFVRAVLPVKVISSPLPYNFGVWIEVSKDSMDRIYDLWDADDQHAEPPFKGLLANGIPTRPGSLGLAGTLQLTGPAMRPCFTVSDTTAALYVDQQYGVTAHQIMEYTNRVLNTDKPLIPT